ncbi:hypothetical protein [Candidatus Phytoplasma prunorum]|uniref:hypothetical protein n=1 Tax=Candidatus Phytoplasma prunorum TaxID=47565 RepID=UPI002FF23A25
MQLINGFSSAIFIIYIINIMNKKLGKLDYKSLISSKQNSQFTFSDVVGNDEEKEEMKELIDFLKQPRKYKDIGAVIPKGVLLEGSPDTVKILLAKALAGEAKAPFYAVYD